MKDLSIIIVSYNTSETTEKCVQSVIKSLAVETSLQYEIVVVDNASKDSSVEILRELTNDYSNIRIIENKQNVGFSRANNQGARQVEGRYILFLNSDVMINKVDFDDVINYLDKNKDVGGLTVKVNLRDNEIDPASHRGFPTLWRSFCYFSGLERVLGEITSLRKFFGGYHLLDNDFNKIHEIDSPSGAFFLINKELFNKLGGFDEDFFMYGEDLDLAYRIKKQNKKIIYYPKWQVTHLKYQSGLQKDKRTRQTIRKHFYQAMKIFYNKHYVKKYPNFLNKLVYLIIDLRAKLICKRLV